MINEQLPPGMSVQSLWAPVPRSSQWRGGEPGRDWGVGLEQEHPDVLEELWYLGGMFGVLKLHSEPVGKAYGLKKSA